MIRNTIRCKALRPNQPPTRSCRIRRPSVCTVNQIAIIVEIRLESVGTTIGVHQEVCHETSHLVERLSRGASAGGGDRACRLGAVDLRYWWRTLRSAGRRRLLRRRLSYLNGGGRILARSCRADRGAWHCLAVLCSGPGGARSGSRPTH